MHVFLSFRVVYCFLPSTIFKKYKLYNIFIFCIFTWSSWIFFSNLNSPSMSPMSEVSISIFLYLCWHVSAWVYMEKNGKYLLKYADMCGQKWCRHRGLHFSPWHDLVCKVCIPRDKDKNSCLHMSLWNLKCFHSPALVWILNIFPINK